MPGSASTPESPRPSTRQLARSVLLAMAGAVVLLVLVILPAEHGIDPTGVGRALGLTALASPADASASSKRTEIVTLPSMDIVGGNENLTAVSITDPRQPVPLPNPSVHQAEGAAPRTQTLQITLGPDERTEIKAVVARGKMILYSWQADRGTVYVDFHGHDPSLGDGFWVRYEERDGVSAGHGSLVAPFDGQHGWYWLNINDFPIFISLTVSGYQEAIVDHGLL